MASRKKWRQSKVKALEQLLKTFDRFEIMPPYLVHVEMKPTSYLSNLNDIEYEQPEIVYGVVIRIMIDKGTTMRITIDEDES